MGATGAVGQVDALFLAAESRDTPGADSAHGDTL